jgi:hypothetical protein
MARQKKWASESERKAAYRAKKAGLEGDPPSSNGDLAAMAEEADAAEIATDAGRGTVEWQGEDWPKLRPEPSGGEEAYVAEARRAAELHLAEGGSNPTVAGAGRAERAERYARWRYRGYLAGQVDGL